MILVSLMRQDSMWKRMIIFSGSMIFVIKNHQIFEFVA